LYGGSRKQVMESIAMGRMGVMPPHQDFLGEDKVHLLAAYVYSLSTGQEQLEE
jgi:cytochrome c oxidase cbb3-type subunit 3